jgi:hypothetical protein
VETWGPLFAVALRIPRDQMVELSIPEMVDHVDYWAEMNKGGQDG